MDAYPVIRAEGPVVADVEVPPSKSISNRALICAALVDGSSEIIGVAPGDDTTAMIDCLTRLGCGIGVRDDHGVLVADIEGTAGDHPQHAVDLPAKLAGTTSRFITALASLGGGPFTIDGDPPLRQRPMAPLHDALVALGATVEPGGDVGTPPGHGVGPAARRRRGDDAG